VALVDALRTLQERGVIQSDPLKQLVAAISVGVYAGNPVLDLDYPEDSHAETDMNIIMNEAGGFIEVQGTAEGDAYSRKDLEAMLTLAEKGIQELVTIQRQVLAG